MTKLSEWTCYTEKNSPPRGKEWINNFFLFSLGAKLEFEYVEIGLLTINRCCGSKFLSGACFSPKLPIFNLEKKYLYFFSSCSGGTISLHHSITPSLLQSFTPSLLHSFTPSLLHSFTPSLLHSFTPSLLHSFTPSLLHSFTPSLLHSFTPSLLHSFTPSLLHSFTPSLLHSFTSR